jgi:hypothetical protein
MRRHAYLLFAAFCAVYSTAGLADTRYQAVIAEEEAAAYREMTSGAVWDGTVRLIELLRGVPPDDPLLADSMVGPAQLLGFSVAFLMDWPERFKLLAEVLDPKAYVTDKLLIAGVKCGGDLGQYETMRAVHDLLTISRGDHEAAAATALCALSSTYYFRTYPHIKTTTARLYIHYGNLELARGVLRQSVRNTVRDSRTARRKAGTVFKDVIYAGGRAETVRAADPVLAEVTDAMPALRLSAIDAEVVGRWSAMAVNAPDPAVRRTCLLLAGYFEEDPACAADIAAPRRALAERAPDSPEVPLARAMLLETACRNRNFEEIEHWAGAVLAHGLLPAAPERCLYESDMRAIQRAAGTCTRHGRFAEAERLHARLGAKYPGSALADECGAAVDALRADPVAAALRLLDADARALVRAGNPLAAQRVYLDVAETATHPALAGACRDRAGGVSKAPSPPPPPGRPW